MPGPGEYRPDPSPGHHRASRTCPSPRSAARAEITVAVPVHAAVKALSRSAGATHPPRPGQPPDRSAPRHDCDLFPALLHPLPQVFQCRHD